MRRSHLLPLSGALSHGAQRPACFPIGPADGLSSAIFVKGTKGSPGRLQGLGGGPAPLGLWIRAERF